AQLRHGQGGEHEIPAALLHARESTSAVGGGLAIVAVRLEESADTQAYAQVRVDDQHSRRMRNCVHRLYKVQRPCPGFPLALSLSDTFDHQGLREGSTAHSGSRRLLPLRTGHLTEHRRLSVRGRGALWPAFRGIFGHTRRKLLRVYAASFHNPLSGSAV